MEKAPTIDELAGDQDEDGNKSGWELPREDSLVPDMGDNERKALFRCVKEQGRRVGMTLGGDESSLLKLVEDLLCMHVIL